MPTPGDLWDSSVAWGCLVHALAACVSLTLLLSPPWGDTGVPAFTLLSRTLAPGTAPLAAGRRSPRGPGQTLAPARLSGLVLPTGWDPEHRWGPLKHLDSPGRPSPWRRWQFQTVTADQPGAPPAYWE